MKKISLLLVIFVSLTAFTCENEGLDPNIETETINPADPSNSTSIVGTWLSASLDASTESSITAQNNTTNVTSAIVGENLNYTITFTDTNTFTTSGDYDLRYTITTPNETTTNTQNYMNVTGDGTYELTGTNMITFNESLYDLQVNGIDTSAIESMPQEIQYTLSADGQTLTFTQNQQQIQTVQETEISVTVISTSVFTRQ